MTGSIVFCGVFSSATGTGALCSRCSGRGVTVALRRSLSLALAARMSVLKTCGLFGSRVMYPPAESEKRSKTTVCSGLMPKRWRSCEFRY